ncbi:folylpolyglutamate synthase/dihydrofolate synthase family protein [Arenibacter sp. GZD96]|uniref:bifunctional folylpolyglutamate synthase/dihydrofolate synthase n=1 Tax=Aurantibrevibacter litoralis TaxID=3106030 RepID=UPI002AFFA17C|nr:folylpolyglutamate synthase/dihydrofolate synthase family protein [Arenibacter sp. GZD-96]MEA1785965.1 folylpolyglutamate synthase/dihydrofolate synthase family protein [Arenibacter sp. GZD-96]
MSYKETLAWMYGQLPMYQHSGKSAYSPKLDAIKEFSNYLNQPETKFKSIHVGGTNGKGSSSHMLASILQEAGYTVGLYTSPHLKDFRERIKINGIPVSRTFVTRFVQRHLDFLSSKRLSFFEMTVGMAFDYFAHKKVDIAIIEVGLGGRLDSTNIILPQVSLITNIGFDHIDILGDTLELIATEKAGIIKPNVPVVISEYQEETAPIFIDVASKTNSKILFASKERLKKYKVSLLGNYQQRNIKGVLCVLQQLKGFTITEQHIIAGLLHVVENTGLLGRWHVLQEKPKVICDTAHNSEGLALVLDQVKHEKFRRLHLVIGFVKDKNLDAILPLFPKDAQYYFARPNIARGLAVKTVKEKARENGLEGKIYVSVKSALRAALKKAHPDDLVFVGGSTFVVAEVV